MNVSPSESTVLRDLAHWQVPMSSSDPAGAVADRFRCPDERMRTVIVRRADGSLGATGRDSFFTMMTGELGFGWALHASQEIGAMLEHEPMVRSGDSRVVDVGLELLHLGGSPVFDDVVVRDGERVGTVGIDEIYRFIGEEFRRRSVLDDLTGLLNRRGVMNGVRDLLRAAAIRPLDPGGVAAQVLFVDLDRFKLVNDAFGHAAGDLVIAEAAERLRRAAPEAALLARVGGDEFLVVLDGSSSSDWREVTNRLVAAFEEPFPVARESLHVSATVGLATASAGDDAAEVIRRADLAMYERKRRGPHEVRPAPVDVDELTDLAQLEAALPEALERHEFAAAYQPEISLLTGAVVGMEALARWDAPGREISPGVFIPIAERCGHLPALTDRMLDLVAADLARRDGADGAVPTEVERPFVAVNASASHCASPGFATAILRHLERISMDPARLVLEVTESVVFDHMERIIRSADELGRSGVRVVLDDFGAGYSSLAVLAQLPLAGVKLDRSFVVDMVANERTATTVSAVVELAHRFGLYVVAEGVETAEQHAAVVDAGCDVGQGYLYGAPSRSMPVFGVELPRRVSTPTVLAEL